MYYFTDDCRIGVEVIDAEHEELFRIVGEIKDLLENEYINDKYDRIRELLSRLEDYAENHFRHEEEYMEKIDHPELELQKKQHLVFCEKIMEGDMTVGHDQQQVLEDLLKYLIRWLYRHIIGSDLMIGKLMPVEEWKKKADFAFTDKYRTGIELIDAEHAELFRIIREVHCVIADELVTDKYDAIIKLLEDLRTYTKEHFADEEEYMEAIGYEGLEAQKRAHDAFVARLDGMDLSEIDEHQQDALEEIMEFLAEWLVNHILHSDKLIPKKHIE